MRALDEALELEMEERLTERCAADAEYLGQLRFVDLASRLQSALHETVEQVAPDGGS
jgi:hypothetical protein